MEIAGTPSYMQIIADFSAFSRIAVASQPDAA
jgi:hypothetical protein